jgi:hypothetical protein
MNKIFIEELDKLVVEFIDNILIYAEINEEQEKYFIDVLEKLIQNQLYAEFEKYEFWQ